MYSGDIISNTPLPYAVTQSHSKPNKSLYLGLLRISDVRAMTWISVMGCVLLYHSTVFLAKGFTTIII